jgi:hypothetical protein
MKVWIGGPMDVECMTTGGPVDDGSMNQWTSEC